MPENYKKLYNCTDINEIDEILNEIGLTNDTYKRLMFVYYFTGVRCVFDDGLELEEKYAVAKEMLADGDWKILN
jgi:hypothetical protein